MEGELVAMGGGVLGDHPSRFFEFVKRRGKWYLQLWNDDRIEYASEVKPSDFDVAQRLAEGWLEHDWAVTVEHSILREKRGAA